jgi:hypothetical protein
VAKGVPILGDLLGKGRQLQEFIQFLRCLVDEGVVIEAGDKRYRLQLTISEEEASDER